VSTALSIPETRAAVERLSPGEHARVRSDALDALKRTLPVLEAVAADPKNRSVVTANRLLAELAGFKQSGAIARNVTKEKVHQQNELFFAILERELGLERAASLWDGEIVPKLALIWGDV
jgi:hypothetical protein